MKYLLLAIMMVSCGAIVGQKQPVTWDYEVTSEGDTYTIITTATIADNWRLYSQHTKEGGPIATTFTYDGIELEGETEELSKAKTEYSDLFELEVTKFSKKAVFSQKFKPIATSEKGTITINFMCCDNMKCLPPTDVSFTFDL